MPSSLIKNGLRSFIPVYAFLFLVMISPPLRAVQEPAVGIVERLNDYVPEGITLVDEQGRTVDIRSQIDMPTVIAFVYYNCPGICTPLMDGIADVIAKLDMELGEDYQVMCISFEPKEGPELAGKKKTNYMNLLTKQWEDIGRRGSPDTEGWRFFTGDSANISRITDVMGYRYQKTGNDYIHSGGIILLSPEGKIVRYINKTYFIPFELKMALIEASEGKAGPTVNKLLRFCYTYDTARSGYVLNVTRVAGAIIILLALLTLGGLVLYPRLRNKKSITETQA